MLPLSAESPVRCVAWFYKCQLGVVHGPSVIETLCTLWRCGELTSDTLVKPEHAARFVRIGEAPALLQLLASHALLPSDSAFKPLSALLDDAEASAFVDCGDTEPQAPPPGSDWCALRSTCLSLLRGLWRLTVNAARRDALFAERNALARAREQLRQDVAAFERYRADATAVLEAKRALLEERERHP
jgi:hypothetical protein